MTTTAQALVRDAEDRPAAGRPRRGACGFGVTAAFGPAAATLHDHCQANRRAIATDPVGDELVRVAPQRVRNVTSADGTPLFVAEYGPPSPDGDVDADADVPTVVLAHGWTCSIDFWTPQLRALPDRCHVVAYDQRGHGRSWNGTTTGFTLDALADDLRAVLDATVPPGRRAVLVGHSMGAMATIAFARRHHDLLTERVAAVVLASTGVRELTPSAAFLGLPRLFDPLFQPLVRSALTIPAPAFGPNPVSQRVLRFIALSPSASPAQVEFCNRIVSRCQPRSRAAWGAAITEFDQYEALGALDVPTYVVVGTADRLTPVRHSRSIAAALPRLVSLTELPGVGHMTTVEAAGVVNTLVLGAVDRAVGRRVS